MNDPEYRKLRTAQNRLNVERSFAGLAEELGLSEGEAARLFDLLAEQQTAQMIDNQLQSANRPQDQAGRDEITRRREALVREQEQAVATMLGSRFTQFREFQESRPARGQVTSLNSQLGQAGLPLTDAQKRSLTSVMFADQQRRTLEARTLAQAPRPNATDPESRVKALEDNLKRSEESSRQLLDAIAPHLTASQLAAYRKQMEDQATANRASVQLQIQQQRLQSRLQAQQGQ